MSTSPVVEAPPRAERIAAGILRGAEYDFGSLQASPALVLDRPARRGVRVMAAQTSRLLFAAKHVVIDGRWRRFLGLALFWLGLGALRRRSRALALGVHVACNGGGVVLGHITQQDRF